MDTYSLLREFADSWVLLAMFTFFLGVIVWAYLPSQRPARKAASEIPFRYEKPACSGKCAACKGIDLPKREATHG